jgi:hypothetical protein
MGFLKMLVRHPGKALEHLGKKIVDNPVAAVATVVTGGLAGPVAAAAVGVAISNAESKESSVQVPGGRVYPPVVLSVGDHEAQNPTRMIWSFKHMIANMWFLRIIETHKITSNAFIIPCWSSTAINHARDAIPTSASCLRAAGDQLCTE